MTAEVFALPERWTQAFTIFQHLAMVLLPLFFIISIFIYALQAFEGVRLESNVFQLILTTILIALWPEVLMGIKTLVDSFNDFLIQDVFHMSNQHSLISPSTLDELSRATDFGDNWWNLKHFVNFFMVLILVTAKLIIYGLFLIFFFFYAALGPLVIARGVLSENLEVSLDLIKQVTLLLLWQSTFLIMVGLVDKTVGSSPHFMLVGDDGFFFKAAKAIGLAILILCVPTVTKKFADSISAAFVPHGFKLGGAVLGFTALAALLRAPGRLSGAAVAAEAEGGGLAESIKWGSESAFHFVERAKLHDELHKAETEARESQEAIAEAAHEREMDTEILEEEAEIEEKIHEHMKSEMHEKALKTHLEIEKVQEEIEAKHVAESVESEISPLPGLDTLHKGPGMETPIRRFLFPKKAQIKKPAEENIDDVTALRTSIALSRGAVGSDKYKDMEKQGISHNAFISGDPQILRAYKAKIDQFNSRFGWLYDATGKFTGPEQLRPTSPKNPNEGTET
ncbi:MAG: hypothetical protein JWQ35_2123 [Bacteriovoracaceae bacterium]|nr:hypothetical protein [Bacteriovoracaceae bacterium]